MHLRSDGVLPPSSMRTVEPKRESIPNKDCKLLTDPVSLLTIFKTIYQWANETIRQMRPAQSFAAMNTHHDPSLNTNTTHSTNQERDATPPRLEEGNTEDISIYFLRPYSTHPNWKQIVSTCNDYGQTLAHIAVTLGYSRLLQHLVKWQVDLNVVDSMGLSALHYAYLLKQEECAKVLIHSGVDRFILDDLGRSPADLDPSLEVRLRSTMGMDSDSSAEGAPPIECDTEMPDNVGKLYEKDILIQKWMRLRGDERRGGVPLSRGQSQETSSHAALDSADESVRSVGYGRSFSLGTHTPDGPFTPAVAEEIDLEALIEPGTPPHISHPPSPIYTQESSRPFDTGRNPLSHPGPLGSAINTPDLEDTQLNPQVAICRPLGNQEQSPVSTNSLVLSRDVKEQNDANDGRLLQRSSSSPKNTRVAIPTSSKAMRLLYDRPIARGQRSISVSSMESTDAMARVDVRNGVRQFVRDNPHVMEPCIGEPVAMAITGSNSRLGTPGESLYSVFFSSSRSGESPFTCHDCGRVDASVSHALGHQRKDHFSHYPFPCQGGAGHPAW
jgi:hypothetical protein